MYLVQKLGLVTSSRTGFTDPENGTTSYVYDTLNRLQTLTPPTAFSGTASFGFSYDGLSPRTQMTRPNGMKSVYAYDNRARLLRGSPFFGPKFSLLKVDRCLQYIVDRSLLLGLWEL